MVTKKKQQSWLDFKSGKGAKKKVRSFSDPSTSYSLALCAHRHFEVC